MSADDVEQALQSRYACTGGGRSTVPYRTGKAR